MKTSILILAGIYFLSGCGKDFQQAAVVVGKSYAPSETNTGMSSKGSFVTTFSPEQYTVIVREPSGRVSSHSVSASYWATARENDQVSETCNTIWGCTIN